jgi:hypothetical protein
VDVSIAATGTLKGGPDTYPPTAFSFQTKEGLTSSPSVVFQAECQHEAKNALDHGVENDYPDERKRTRTWHNKNANSE